VFGITHYKTSRNGMRNVVFSILLTLITLVTSGCYSPKERNLQVGDFSIYLPAQKMSAVQISKADLDTLELEDKPILSIDDIISYSKETHEIELTASAYERIGGLEVPVTTGIPFVVCVGREPIYSGAFWVSYSSMSFYDSVVIDTLPATQHHSIRIQLGYPESPELFRGEDRRSDPRILQSLERAGKLK
jgi:hypothetical protein